MWVQVPSIFKRFSEVILKTRGEGDNSMVDAPERGWLRVQVPFSFNASAGEASVWQHCGKTVPPCLSGGLNKNDGEPPRVW